MTNKVQFYFHLKSRLIILCDRSAVTKENSSKFTIIPFRVMTEPSEESVISSIIFSSRTDANNSPTPLHTMPARDKSTILTI